VAEVAVIGIPDEKWGETVTALVVLAEGASASETEIIAFRKQRLAGYKAPTFVEFRGAIGGRRPGKVQKLTTRTPHRAHPVPDAPASKTGSSHQTWDVGFGCRHAGAAQVS
jgi:fatty-acyl-CoA synthase